jgi:hypothetical protein
VAAAKSAATLGCAWPYVFCLVAVAAASIGTSCVTAGEANNG